MGKRHAVQEAECAVRCAGIVLRACCFERPFGLDRHRAIVLRPEASEPFQRKLGHGARRHVTAPQCVPSRAGLLSGRYQQRFGVDQNGFGPLLDKLGSKEERRAA